MTCLDVFLMSMLNGIVYLKGPEPSNTFDGRNTHHSSNKIELYIGESWTKQHLWLNQAKLNVNGVVDATDVPLGRLSAVVAGVLRGKNKTNTLIQGDFVIVINAEKS